MRCNATRCGTGVPPGRPFCTDHMKKLPYSITKEFWNEHTKPDAVKRGIEYLEELDAA